jgi:hypothetical protein
LQHQAGENAKPKEQAPGTFLYPDFLDRLNPREALMDLAEQIDSD